MSNPNNFPKLPSNKKFGYFFSAIFAIIALYSETQENKIFTAVMAIISVQFLAATFWRPQLLKPLNRFWYELGMLLGKFISPVVLGIMFFGLITPIAIVKRLFGRDELKIKKSFVQSYWIDRTPPGPPKDSFYNQF